MDARDFLKRPTRIYGDIVTLQERIENLRMNMLPKAISYDKDRVQTSPQDPMPDFAAKIDELDRELVGRMKDYENAQDDVQDVIRQVNNADAREVLAKRYLGQKSWRSIERDMYLCDRQIYRIHLAGLSAVEKILRYGKDVI